MRSRFALQQVGFFISIDIRLQFMDDAAILIKSPYLSPFGYMKEASFCAQKNGRGVCCGRQN
jgi:hypothetical protein